MRSRRAVGSLIGIGFLLMILAVGFSYYNIINRIEDTSNERIQLMAEFEKDAADEELEITSVKLTVGNSLNLTIKNTGNEFSVLEWVGVFDETLNTQDYYRLDASLNPVETQKNIGNASIVMNPLNDYTIQVLSKLGNVYYGEYPEPVTGGTGSGGGGSSSTYYFVNTTGDANAPIEVGTLSLFTAMQAGPDHINSTLTEEQIISPLSVVTLVDAESFEGTWLPTDWIADGAWNKESDEVYDGSSSADFDGAGSGVTGQLYSPLVDCSDATSITADFYFFDDNLDNNEMRFYFWDGSNWDEMIDLSTYGAEDIWHHIEITTTDTQYFDNGFYVRFSANDVENNEHGYIDLVTISKETGGTGYYDLDVEVSWTDLPSKTNEYLTIYGGVQGVENLQVDYWDGSWNSLTTDITAGYNVIDVSAALTGSSFVIRFTDTTGAGDAVEDTWGIDTVYLHLFD